MSVLTLGINTYPLVNIYEQATAGADGSLNHGATFGLLFIIWCATVLCCIGTTVTNSRIYWSLARDNAVPFSRFFAIVNERLSCPVPATLFVGRSQDHRPQTEDYLLMKRMKLSSQLGLVLYPWEARSPS